MQKILAWLITPELIESFIKFTSYLVNRRHRTAYKVLNSEISLELLDSKGRKAIYRKVQTIKFLQDTIAYQDTAWGNGDIFADYKVSPGKAVDFFRDGDRHRILISLRGTKQKYETTTIRIERLIRDGYTHDTEDFQADVDHTTKELSLAVIFPKNRHPKQVQWIEQQSKRSINAENTQTLPDGRQKVSWQIKHPKLHERYIMRWHW